MQVDFVEKDGTIQKLRELVESRDNRIASLSHESGNMQKRIEELTTALREA